jgi:hypothetical protein
LQLRLVAWGRDYSRVLRSDGRILLFSGTQVARHGTIAGAKAGVPVYSFDGVPYANGVRLELESDDPLPIANAWLTMWIGSTHVVTGNVLAVGATVVFAFGAGLPLGAAPRCAKHTPVSKPSIMPPTISFLMPSCLQSEERMSFLDVRVSSESVFDFR